MQVEPRVGQLRLRLILVGFLRKQFGALRLDLRQQPGNVGPGILQICFSLQELCPEDGRVNLRDHLVLGYLCIEVGKEPGNCARHLRAHLHRRDRIDRARGLHDLRNVALLHFRGVILHRRAAANRPEGSQ